MGLFVYRCTKCNNEEEFILSKPVKDSVCTKCNSVSKRQVSPHAKTDRLWLV